MQASHSPQLSAPAGTPDGFFRTVYSFENEILLERLDRTVHAAAMSALQKTDIGYRFYFAVYVQRVSWITAISMALIDPFRRWIVYSAIFKQIERSWTAHFGPTNLHIVTRLGRILHACLSLKWAQCCAVKRPIAVAMPSSRVTQWRSLSSCRSTQGF